MSTGLDDLDTGQHLIAPTRAAELLAYPVQTDDTAAELLHMSPSQIQRLRQSGQLPFLRLGRLVRIPTSALAEWIDTQVGAA